MTGQQKAAIIAIGTVIISLLNIVLLSIISGSDKIVVRAVRFFLTCLFAFYLRKGAEWARWLVGILSLLAVLSSVIAISGLISAGASVFSILGIWMFLMACFYAWVSYMLLLDRDVASHFNPTSGF